MQKGLYEYARARAGHYAKVLFSEPGFREAIENSRWRAFPLGLAMVAEMIEGELRNFTGDRATALERVSDVTLRLFDAFEKPAVIEAVEWAQIRDELARQLALIGTHAAKPARDIPTPFVDRYFALMPIHEKLRAGEYPTVKNYLRVAMCNIHHEFTTRLDGPALARAMNIA